MGPSARRTQILRAAKELFRHYGVSKTTVADIARAAGVGVGTVYLEFSSKDIIIGELSNESLGTVIKAMRGAAAGTDGLADEGTGPFAERLRRTLDRRLECIWAMACRGKHGLDLFQCQCQAARAAYERHRIAEEDLLTELLQAAHNAGEFAVVNPRVTAKVLLRMHENYAAAAVQSGDLEAVRQELVVAYVLVIDGLRHR